MKIILVLIYSLLVTGMCYARLGGSDGGGGPATRRATNSLLTGEVGSGGPRSATMILNPFIVPIERNLIEDLQLDDGTILTVGELAKTTIAKEERKRLLFNLKGPVRDIMLKDGEIIDLLKLRRDIEDKI